MVPRWAACLCAWVLLGALCGTAAAETGAHVLLARAQLPLRPLAGPPTDPLSSLPAIVLNGTGPDWVSLNGAPALRPTNARYSVVYSNGLTDNTLVHAHGLLPPASLDNVPGVQTVPLAANRSSTTEFSIDPAILSGSGSYFVHSHVGYQHTFGASAALVIPTVAPDALLAALGPAGAAAWATQTEVMMFLEEWCPYYVDSFDRTRVRARARRARGASSSSSTGSHDDDAVLGQNMQCDNSTEIFTALLYGWLSEQPFDFEECSAPGMDDDVLFRVQTANGRQVDDPQTVALGPGAAVRLRVVAASVMSSYLIELDPAIVDAKLVATDGQWTRPLGPRNTFWVGVAQRLDILFTLPRANGSYAVRAVGGSNTLSLQSALVFTVGDASPIVLEPVVTPPIGMMDSSMELELSALTPLAPRAVDRTLAVNLTGDNGFDGINGRSFSADGSDGPNPYPLLVALGERVCINMTNYNADPHAMHLHGHVFQVVAINGERVSGAMRDVVVLDAGRCATMTVCFDANAPGVWPFHCHMLYHMMAGMFTTVEYVDESIADTFTPVVAPTRSKSSAPSSLGVGVRVFFVAGLLAVAVAVTVVAALVLRWPKPSARTVPRGVSWSLLEQSSVTSASEATAY